MKISLLFFSYYFLCFRCWFSVAGKFTTFSKQCLRLTCSWSSTKSSASSAFSRNSGEFFKGVDILYSRHIYFYRVRSLWPPSCKFYKMAADCACHLVTEELLIYHHVLFIAHFTVKSINKKNQTAWFSNIPHFLRSYIVISIVSNFHYILNLSLSLT